MEGVPLPFWGQKLLIWGEWKSGEGKALIWGREPHSFLWIFSAPVLVKLVVTIFVKFRHRGSREILAIFELSSWWVDTLPIFFDKVYFVGSIPSACLPAARSCPTADKRAVPWCYCTVTHISSDQRWDNFLRLR